jgi:glycosyltransferase involved in cell wall biosynthesis
MHTQPSDQNGTDLKAVKEALCDPSYVNVYFSTDRLNPDQMNLLYNVADVTMLLSSNEGWGLSLTESMMAGTMIIPNVTGGMQDQCRFENEKGEWIDFDSDFPSNHRGTYKKCGEWAEPVFPSNISLAGSPATPYIFDDRCQPEDAATAMKKVYDLGKEERIKRGLSGREWVTSPEAEMTAENMSKNVARCMEEAFDKFVPRPSYDIFKIEYTRQKYIQHKLTGY